MMCSRVITLFFVLAVFVSSTSAIDYTVDPTFNSPLGGLDDVLDIAVQPDGKVVITGRFQVIAGTPRNYIARLNTDGSLDATFTSPFSPPVIQPNLGDVNKVKLLPDGKLLVTGKFQVGSLYTEYARLNTDGTVDATMTLGTLGDLPSEEDIEPLPDGKFLLCGGRGNPDPASLLYRLNADGTRDTSFHSAFGIGVCRDLIVRSDGKVLMAGFLLSNTGVFDLGPLLLLNSDGSRDKSFDTALPNDANALDFAQFPDGRFLIQYVWQNQDWVKRLNADGSLDLDLPHCKQSRFVPLSDGTALISGCRKSSVFTSQSQTWGFGLMRPNGSLDPGFDWISLSSPGVLGIQVPGNGNAYIHGRIAAGVANGVRVNVVRLIPDVSVPKAKFDFDGDGRSDLAVFRPSDHYWYINQSTAGPAYLQWGLPTDKLAATHYDNDGKTDIGIFRDGVWYEISSVSGYRQTLFGAAGDKPMFGDFGGVGGESRLLRGLRSGVATWLFFGGGTRILPGEQISDIPVMGDFEGDGRDEMGYFRDGVWYGGISDPVPPWQPVMQWGIAGDIPVPADYDGDRQTDYAIFRPSTGEWWVNRSTEGIFVLRFGLNGDIPVPADYDGDGKVDIAIYRNGQWWQFRTSTGTVAVGNWGLAGDIPIPAQHQF